MLNDLKLRLFHAVLALVAVMAMLANVAFSAPAGSDALVATLAGGAVQLWE